MTCTALAPIKPKNPTFSPPTVLINFVWMTPAPRQGLELVVRRVGGGEMHVAGEDRERGVVRDGGLQNSGQPAGRPVELVVSDRGGVVAERVHEGQLRARLRRQELEQRPHHEVAGVQQQHRRAGGGRATPCAAPIAAARRAIPPRVVSSFGEAGV